MRIRNVFVGALVALGAVLAPTAAGASQGDGGRAVDGTTVGGFTGPVFGLGAGRGDSVLVADAAVGIRVVDHGRITRTIPLPGVSDASTTGRGPIWAVTGAADPNAAESDGGQALWRVTGGHAEKVVNLYAFEAANNPDGGRKPDGTPELGSNPFSVQSLGSAGALVTDAAANDLLRVSADGQVTVLATLPTQVVPTDNIKALAGCPAGPPDFCGLPPAIPAQAVATSVAVGPDGWYYVGELKGFPAPTGRSNVWKVSPRARNATCPSADCVKVFDGGFTSIVGLGFGEHGTLYVAELDEASWAAVEIFQHPTGGTVNACRPRQGTCRPVATGIPVLTGFTVGSDGHLWVTRNGLTPGQAEIVELDH